MLGSTSEADDAVQEAWLRLSRSGAGGVENLGGWLTTVVARVCLNMLRSRRSRREEALEGPLGEPLDARVPDPIVGRADGADPEHEALLADGVGLALLVVLETLTPAERLAFVLHDTFGVPFAEIAPIVGRSPAAARQLASRARNRVRGAAPPRRRTSPASGRSSTRSSPPRAAATSGRCSRARPEVVLRADYGAAGASRLVRGASAVAGQALTYSRLAPFSRPALVNGAAGAVTAPGGSCSRSWASRWRREDRRDRHPRRPRAPAPPRPSGGPRRLTPGRPRGDLCDHDGSRASLGLYVDGQEPREAVFVHPRK
jgi:RNA polymerase sigma-70 factor (ECF subfamily)